LLGAASGHRAALLVDYANDHGYRRPAAAISSGRSFRRRRALQTAHRIHHPSDPCRSESARVKERNILAPIFVLFIVTHAFAILYAIASHVTGLPKVFHDAHVDYTHSVSTIGFLPLMLILLRAYSLGGGTYTGIEAVSNGVSMLREPRVRTGKRTMALMAVSLAFTAGGIMFAYLLTNSTPQEGKTMNAVLLTNLFGRWHLGAFSAGTAFVIVSLVAEAALLFVAAQAGFWTDRGSATWLSIRDAASRFTVSDRLVTRTAST
jgi:hypothetical protein